MRRYFNPPTSYYLTGILFLISILSWSNMFATQPNIDSLQRESIHLIGNKKLAFLHSVSEKNLRKNYPVSMLFSNMLLIEAEKQNNILYQAKACGLLGEAYLVLEDSVKTLQYFSRFLLLAKKTNNISVIAMANNAMGKAYQPINSRLSLNYYLTALNLQRKTKNYIEIRKLYNNLGVLYERNYKDYNTALGYYQNSLLVGCQNNDSIGITVSKINIGEVYCKLGLFKQSEQYLNEAFILAQSLKLDYLQEQVSKALSQLYEKSGRFYSAYPLMKKYFEFKIDRINESSRLHLQDLEMKYQLDKKTKEIAVLNTQGSRQKFFLLMLLFISFIIIVFSIILGRQIRRFKRTNELLQIRNHEIEEQSLQLEKKNLELKELSAVASNTDNAIIIANADGIIQYVNDSFIKLTGVTFDDLRDSGLESIYVLSQNPNTKDAVAEAIATRGSVTIENQTVSIKGCEQFGQTTITPIFDEHDNLQRLLFMDTDITKLKLVERELFSRQQDLTTSIRYARRLQKELLPPFKSMSSYFSDFLLFVRPKDIVSGDFYWMKEVGSKLFIVMADCTGHGVPGAFMSVLSIALLNDVFTSIYKEKKEIVPGHLLDELRVRVQDMLNQNTEEIGLQDGMDISFVCIDRETQILSYAGAYSSMCIIRKTEKGYENFPLKGDRMPVGIHPRCTPFNTLTFKLLPEDRCYMFTDGYMIQPGGPNHKKISRKQFMNLLLSVQDRNMESQWLELKSFLRNWINAGLTSGEYVEQIDDITVLGFQLKPFQS